jgi:hypothetical protein
MFTARVISISRQALCGVAAVAAAAALVPASALAATANDQTQFSVTAGSLSFSSAPALPTLSALTLNGQAQTTNTTMTNFTVQDATGSGSGWNVTVAGNTGKSPVFKQYCPNASCGTDSGPGYVTSGQTLAANSLTLSSTGASFAAQNGSTGTGPTLQCASACNVDSASPVKIASAASSAGMGTWATTGWSGPSLALSTPSTIRTLPTNEVYRADLVWTINSGP